jgi:hypothetical protein
MSAKKLIEEAEATRSKLREPEKKAADVVPDAPPAVRKGEDTMSSRPFRLMNMFGLIGGQLSPDYARVEYDLMTRYRKMLDESQQTVQGANHKTWFYPVGKSMLTDAVAYHPVTKELMSAAQEGMSKVDLDEIDWLKKKIDKSYDPSVQKTAMSYLTETTGGALVAPPEFGELIPLMRNQSALDRAGAKQVPLPPMGKWIAPRVTGPTTGYWIGENAAISESNPDDRHRVDDGQEAGRHRPRAQRTVPLRQRPPPTPCSARTRPRRWPWGSTTPASTAAARATSRRGSSTTAPPTN